MRTVRVYFVDFCTKDIKNLFLYEFLTEKYNVVLDPETPEYLFCSCFGNEAVLYQNCIKILYLAESIDPDFNLFDYAIGFSNISFDDRYFRYPFFPLYAGTDDALAAKSSAEAEEIFNRKGFCSFLYSNANYSAPARRDLFYALSAVGKVDSGGGLLNNMGGKKVENKLEWLKQYRFNIACENTSKPGYVTEKIIEPIMAGCIPIYWGAEDISNDINPKRFINAADYPDFQTLAEDVKAISLDKKRFCDFLMQPCFTEKQKNITAMNDELHNFICHIIDQPLQTAYRVPSYGRSLGYIKEQRLCAKIMRLFNSLRSLKRIFHR